MKNTILVLITLLLLSCSTTDDSGNSDLPSGSLLIQKITTPHSWGEIEEVFHYSNNQLKFIEYDCYDIIRYFEYNNNNKVLNSYRFIDENFDMSTINISEVINSPETRRTEYIYENNRLSSTKQNGELYMNLTYNENGQIKNLFVNDYALSNYLISYENNEIISILDTDSDGDSNLYTFTLDDNRNPFYELFIEYGIIGDDGCNGYHDYMLFRGFPFFANNIITRQRDNAPNEPATIVYLENGLPEAITHDGFNGPYTYFFSY